MLQIASGKLFQQKPGRSNELRGIVYTNLILYKKPIETIAGRLLPTSALQHDKMLIYEFTELIEESPGDGVITSHGIDPYLKDFAALVSFALNVTCTPDLEVTRRLTGHRPSPAVHVVPSQLIRRVFDDEIRCRDTDATQLESVVSDLIGLKRKNYLAAMRAIRTYVTGLHRVAENLEVAYTLLVASIESLAQTHNAPQVDWKDYDENKRKTIDEALCNADQTTAEQVRKALLKIDLPSLRRKFSNFTLDHLQPSFFREEAAGLDIPVGRAELSTALHEAYSLRSGYIHSLRELPTLLSWDSRGDIVRIDQRPYLTFQGLSRLARHVIGEFIKRQPKVETEIYDYSFERAGIVQVPLAPQYWVGRATDLTALSGRKYLNGFLDQFSACIEHTPDAAITRQPDVLVKIEEILPDTKGAQRRSLLVFYLLLNFVVPDDQRMKNFESIRKRYKKEINNPTVEAMLFHLVIDTVPTWTIEKHKEIHNTYFSCRDKTGGLNVSRVLEAGLSLVLAERYRENSDEECARKLICFTVENYPGNATLLEFERTFDSKNKIVWRHVMLPESKTNEELSQNSDTKTD